MSKAGKCLTTGEGVKGIVTTNATVYGSGPPAFNAETKTLDYKVAAPHFTRTGEEFQGAYNLIMRSDVARCFYNFTPEPVKAEISVVEASGTAGKASTTFGETNGWLTLTAKGFTHSAPTVRAKLSQETAATTTAPTTVTAPAATTPPALKSKVKKSISAATFAKHAKISVPKKAKISLSMSAKYAKTCRASQTAVQTLKKGTCVVKVTVTTSSKKKTSKNVTITVK
jgi:VCBS repeat-containing protein